jgi:hypothetical protein
MRALGAFLLWLFAVQAMASELDVAASKRHLTLNGKPFFWLGDTVWLLAQLPTNQELELYLRTRAEQGFTVIQLTAVMGEERVWGTARKTSRGDVPFSDLNTLKPAITPGADPSNAEQYDYWDHLSYVLERIHAHGMRAALVTYFVGYQGDGYKYLRRDNAYPFGYLLAERYRSKPDIIWVLGGDHVPATDEHKAVWNLVAKGIAEALTGREDYSRVLMTYHISGGSSSSQYWHEAPWLDFNMAQTWSAYQDIHPMVVRDYQKVPVKPCGLGEGAYEDGPQYPTKPIDALVIRKQACWSWFAGGYHTYGNGNVWHFDSLKAESTQPWKEALRSRGAATLGHSKKLLESLEWWNLIPDQTLFAEGKGAAAKLNVAMRTAKTNAIAVYLSNPSSIQLRLEKLTGGTTASTKWTNPSTGEQRPGGVFARQTQAFTPPAGWTDALLEVHAKTHLPP